MDYLPGDRFQGLPANHSWNAVFLNGSWQLIDAQWATRYLSAGAQLHDNVVYEYDDFYFLMEPQQVHSLYNSLFLIDNNLCSPSFFLFSLRLCTVTFLRIADGSCYQSS